MLRNLSFNSFEHVDSNYSIQKAWAAFIEKGELMSDRLRPDIIDSWARSKHFGVDPFQAETKEVIKDDELTYKREKNNTLLSYATPHIQILSDSLANTDTIVSITDKNGVILNSFGDNSILKKGEKVRHIPGAVWTEEAAGTNAIGTVLKNKRPVQVLFTEHFCNGWQDWYCAAAPIFNPFTNELLGVFDITGKGANVNPHTISLAISNANHISKYLEQNIYQYGVQMNPFLETALVSTNDAIIIADVKKKILKMSGGATSHLQKIGIQSIASLRELDAFVNLVLEGKEIFIEQEMQLFNDNRKYICVIFPVILDQEILGIVIRIRDSKVKSKIIDKKLSNSKNNNSAKYTFEQLIGTSTKFLKIIDLAKKAAKLDSTLFLSGETGTGKEVFAQSIHHASGRRNKPFIAVNCGAIPRELIESELFGYEAGAFTGAKSKGSPGKFELAQGGTIFLDEIGDMPLNVQVHLLRVLEEKVVTRIGGEKPIPIDVRIISATHKNLVSEVQKGKFREDLFYRLLVIQIQIPSLRERKSDIPLLFQYFIKMLSPQFTSKEVILPTETIQLLNKYKWPGNIRELKNIAEQSLFYMEGDILLPQYLPPELTDRVERSKEFEREKLSKVIKQMDGNITEGAKELGISRATMYRKIKKYNIET